MDQVDIVWPEFARELERENQRLRAALHKIANADYRGNRHPLSVEALSALSNPDTL